jgi:hypothetical protein
MKKVMSTKAAPTAFGSYSQTVITLSNGGVDEADSLSSI